MMKLLAGNSNLPLATAIADYLDMKLTELSSAIRLIASANNGAMVRRRILPPLTSGWSE